MAPARACIIRLGNPGRSGGLYCISNCPIDERKVGKRLLADHRGIHTVDYPGDTVDRPICAHHIRALSDFRDNPVSAQAPKMAKLFWNLYAGCFG